MLDRFQTRLQPVDPQQGTGVAFGQPMSPDRRGDLVRVAEQAQLIGDGRLAQPQPPRRLVLLQPELADQVADPFGFLKKIQIAPLEVLNQRQQTALLFGGVDQDTGHLAQPREL